MQDKQLHKAVVRWIIQNYLMLQRANDRTAGLREIINFVKKQTPYALKYLKKHKNLVKFQFEA